MCAVRPTACACALVSIANGRSVRHAFDGGTALLRGGDADETAELLTPLASSDLANPDRLTTVPSVDLESMARQLQ